MILQIIQPAIPEYRVSLFDALGALGDMDVRVHASASSLNAAILDDETERRNFSHQLHAETGVMRNAIVWQRAVTLSSDMDKGDVLVVCGNPRILSNVPLLLAAKRRGVGVIWWGHGGNRDSSILRFAVRRMLMKLANVILLYTDEEVADYGRLGFDPSKLIATNNSIDQAPIERAKQEWTAERLRDFRCENGLRGKQLLLFCGRLTEKSRFDLALEALSSLRHEGRHVVLAVIGEGDLGSRYAARSVDLALDDHVIWIGALYDQSKIAPWFLSADCFVYPGSIGLSLLHAFGYGLPVVTHDDLAAQMPEIAALRDGENGMLYQKQRFADLVAKISRLLDDSALRANMSRACLETVAGEYSINNMVDRFAEAIDIASQAEK